MSALAGRRSTLLLSLSLSLSLSLAMAIVGLAVSASTASAVIVRLPDGKTLSYMPTPSRAKILGTRFDGVFSNLDYNGGPVMSSNTNYVIYWAPSGTTAYPAGYKTGLDQYFTDLAQDSGGHENADSVVTQYMDSTGNYANYASSFGGGFDDTTPYPTNGCGAGAVPSGTTCLTDAQLRAELANFVTSHGLPRDLTHEYFLVFPPGVENCFDQNPSAGCSSNANPPYNAYCAFHGSTPYAPGSPVIVYSNNPYVNNNNCQTHNWSNGPADGLIDGGLSHEHLESVTDPIPEISWADYTTGKTTGFEVGDKCAYDPGTALGGTGTIADPFYNQIINGRHYYYQQEWSNQGHSCAQRFTFSGIPPTAQFTANPGSGNTMSFDATGSTPTTGVHYHWEFETPFFGPIETETTSPTVSHTYASPGLHAVSLTVYAADGTSAATTRVIETGMAAPMPAFTPSGGPIGEGQPVTFADTSSDSGASIIAESWNFGDGSGPGSGAAPTHTFTALGTYTVTLTITDSNGQMASASHQLTVDEPPSTTFSVTTAKPTTGSPVTFDASASTDPDGSVVSYSWQFGDGTAAGSGGVPVHTYAAGGTYTVTLTVTDSSGLRSTRSQQVAVDELPTASIRLKPKNPASGGAVRFDGSFSADPDGSIVSYAWNFGDGSAPATGSSPKHRYKKHRTYLVTLVVTDSSGISSSATKSVAVVKGAKIKRVSLRRRNGAFYLWVKVTGPGRVRLGHQTIRLTNAGTAKFLLQPGGHRNRKLKLKFTPIAGGVQRKTVKVTIR